MSEKKTVVTRNCRDAVNKLHEVMKLLDLARMDFDYKEKRYTIAITFLSL